jgi:FlaG/FlaF family flagellin (archaellin)
MPLHPNESAVSETIATVLVVALTVIMAALIASYLLGMLNGISQTRTVAATADQPDPTHILVTYRGGPDQTLLSNLTIIWPSGVSQKINFPKVGDVYTATNVAAPYNVTSGKDHVVVTAIFANNMSQVILDTFV